MLSPLTYDRQESSRQRQDTSAYGVHIPSLLTRQEQQRQQSQSSYKTREPSLSSSFGWESIRARTRIIQDKEPRSRESPDYLKRHCWEVKSSMVATRKKMAIDYSEPLFKPTGRSTVRKRPAPRVAKDARPTKARKKESDNPPPASSNPKKVTSKTAITKTGESKATAHNSPAPSKKPLDQGTILISSDDDDEEKTPTTGTTAQTIKALENELEALKKSHSAEIALLKADLQSSKAQAEAHEQDKKAVQKLQTELSTAKAALATAQKNIETLEDTNKQKEQDLKNLKAEMMTLETTLKEERETNQSLHQRRHLEKQQQQKQQQQEEEEESSTLTETTTTRTTTLHRHHRQSSTFPLPIPQTIPLSPSPAMTMASNASSGETAAETDLQRRMRTLQKNFLAMKPDFDTLCHTAHRVILVSRSLDLDDFGTFGARLRDLRNLLERLEKKRREKEQGKEGVGGD